MKRYGRHLDLSSLSQDNFHLKEADASDLARFFRMVNEVIGN